MKKKFVVLNWFLVYLLLFPATFSSPVKGQFKKPENLNCQIELLQRDYKAADRITLKYTFSNTSDKSINILKWNTPLEGINADIFNILLNNQRISYVGRTIKRGSPQPDDYLTIKSGEIITGEVNIDDAYYISSQGSYIIELNTVILDFGYDSPDQLIARKVYDSRILGSNKVTLKLIEDKNLPDFESMYPKEDASPKTPGFVGCSQNQQDIINKALSNAQLYSFGSYFALLNAKVESLSTAPRYITWFGTYGVTNYNTVTNHYDAIYKALTQQTITFHCDCNENYYAYVYPNNPYHVYLCNLFWSAPQTGTDCQFGTIIHEVSHFYVVSSTTDYVYGQAGAKNLAATTPAKAIANADNHEYFAENNPVLALPQKDLGLNLTLYSLLFIGLIGGTAFLIRYKRLQTK
jgi:peptidyl-Lys metalloendopeptidase